MNNFKIRNIVLMLWINSSELSCTSFLSSLQYSSIRSTHTLLWFSSWSKFCSTSFSLLFEISAREPRDTSFACMPHNSAKLEFFMYPFLGILWKSLQTGHLKPFSPVFVNKPIHGMQKDELHSTFRGSLYLSFQYGHIVSFFPLFSS